MGTREKKKFDHNKNNISIFFYHITSGVGVGFKRDATSSYDCLDWHNCSGISIRTNDAGLGRF